MICFLLDSLLGLGGRKVDVIRSNDIVDLNSRLAFKELRTRRTSLSFAVLVGYFWVLG
jgi:hypothetical protein